MNKPPQLLKYPNLYDLYERSVQSPKTHIDWLVSLYHQQRGLYPTRLREDFCGTFQLACAWVLRNRNNSAIGLDLDAEPLNYGRRRHYARLTASQKKRLKIYQENVMTITTPKSDLVFVGNFSFFTLQKRKDLLNYFKKVHRSLREDGMFLLELAGGPGMIEKGTERKQVKKGKHKFTYFWEQKDFDPINHRGQYAIHFQLPNGKKLRDAFTYDWRIWSLPETRELLIEAGFQDAIVYWESSYKGKGTGEFLPMNEGDNSYSWIAYVAGLK